MTANAPKIIHENTLYAEPIFHIGNFPVTNSLLNTWLVVVIIVVFALVLRRKTRLIPRGLQNGVEMVFDAFLGIFDSVTGSRAKSIRFAPFIMTFFFFVLLSNWMGLLPGVGSIGQVVQNGHELFFIPYLRGGTADLNTTLALAIIGIVVSHVVGVIFVGSWNYLNKFINFKTLLEIPRKIIKEPTIILVNPIKFFVGLIEVVGELAKVASLSFRLFGNVFAGEVLLASMSAILAFGLPLPFMFLEVLVGLIQALIFSVLVLIYLSTNTTAEEH